MRKIPFLFSPLLTGNFTISSQSGKGNVCPVSTHIRLTYLIGFSFFLFLTHRIFIHFLVSINLCSLLFLGGERKRDIHFLHSVGFKICFLKFILNIAGSRKKKLLLWLWSCGIASVGLSHQPGWTDTLPPSSSLQGTLLPKSNTPNPTTAFQATSPPSQTLKTPKIYTISKLQPIQPLFIHIYPPPALEEMTQSLRAELASVQSPSSPRLQQSSSWQAHRCASTAGYGSPLPRRTERIISPPAKHQFTTSLSGCAIPATDRFPRAETLEELEHMGSELIQCFGKI